MSSSSHPSLSPSLPSLSVTAGEEARTDEAKFLPYVMVNGVPVQLQKSKVKDKVAHLRILRVELSKAEAETAGISQEHFNSGSAKSSHPPRFERAVTHNMRTNGWWKEASEEDSTRDLQHMEGRTWTLATRIVGVRIVEMTAAEVAEFKKKK